MPPQLSYSLRSPNALFAGQDADSGLCDILTGLPLPSQAQLVTITVTNSTAYALTFEAGAVDPVAAFTSDGTATKAEIVAGLLAAVNAQAAADYSAVNYGGDLVLVAKPNVQFPRAVASTGAGTLVLSALNVSIPFGVAVALDPGRMTANFAQDMAVRLPNATTDKILGITMHTHYFESQYNPVTAINVPLNPVGQPLNVMRSGRIWVRPETAVVAGSDVFFRHAVNGGNTQLGALRADADTATATALSGARFISNAGAGELAVLQISHP